MSNTKTPEYDTKTDKALDAVQKLDMTPAEFARLALACLDQAGLDNLDFRSLCKSYNSTYDHVLEFALNCVKNKEDRAAFNLGKKKA